MCILVIFHFHYSLIVRYVLLHKSFYFQRRLPPGICQKITKIMTTRTWASLFTMLAHLAASMPLVVCRLLTLLPVFFGGAPRRHG